MRGKDCSDVYGKECSDVHGCTNAVGAGMRRSGLQSYCISTVPGGQKEDDCRDAGGRATQGAVAEVELRQEQQPRAMQGAVAEVEPRREQRSRSNCRDTHERR